MLMSWLNLPKNYGDYRGFIYLILCNDKYYIGQKSIIKGGKQLKKRIEMSGWRDYCGSSIALNKDIQSGHKYKKYVLLMCNNKVELNYFEAKLQFDLNVLYDKKSYNGQVRCRCGSKGLSPETNKGYILAYIGARQLIKTIKVSKLEE